VFGIGAGSQDPSAGGAFFRYCDRRPFDFIRGGERVLWGIKQRRKQAYEQDTDERNIYPFFSHKAHSTGRMLNMSSFTLEKIPITNKQ
jgi:hypothetical protein